MVYKEKGEYDKAIELYKNALEIWEQVLGSEHPATAAGYNNLALVYEAKGEYDNAMKFFQKGFEIYQKRKDYKNQFITLLFLINALIKSSFFDYQTLAEYLCHYLELVEIFKEDIKDHIFLFIVEDTFKDIDMEELKKHIPYPDYQERAEKFISQINILAKGLLRNQTDEI